MTDNFTYYRRHLPHLGAPGATYFVTFRLAGSLPQEAVERMREEREQTEKHPPSFQNQDSEQRRIAKLHKLYFAKFESLLDGETVSPQYLKEPAVADIVAATMHEHDGKECDLIAYSIMPNHVHLVLKMLSNVGRDSISTEASCRTEVRQTPIPVLAALMRLIKGKSAREANKLLNRRGEFWQHETYDHIVRDEEELGRIITYILDNPVKAGLVKGWTDWRWSYVRKDLEDWVRLNF